jgi:hypothetical protein
MAVVLAIPFLLVRLVYSIFSTFTHNKSFNLLSGSVTILLCTALIEEFSKFWSDAKFAPLPLIRCSYRRHFRGHWLDLEEGC